jgi:hypothetical protein
MDQKKLGLTVPQLIMGGVMGLVGATLFQVTKGTFMGTLLHWVVGLMLLFGIGFVIWKLSSNKRLVKATPQATETAKRFEAEPGMAVIYVYRSQYNAALIGLDLMLDDKPRGQVRGYGFYRFVVPAGQHMLSGDQRCPQGLSLSVGPGQLAFVEVLVPGDAKTFHYVYEWQNDIAAAQAAIAKLKMYVDATTVSV